jgi:hypothetical protein
MKKIMVIIASIALCVASFPVAVFGDEPAGVEVADENLTEVGAENENEEITNDNDQDTNNDNSQDQDDSPPNGVGKAIYISEVFAFNDAEKYIELYLSSAVSGGGYYLMTAASENGSLNAQLTFEISDSDEEFILLRAGQIPDNFDLKNLNRVIWLCSASSTKNNCRTDHVDMFTYTKLGSTSYSWSRDFEADGEIKLSQKTPGADNQFNIDDEEEPEPELDLCAYISLNEISFSEPEKFIEIINTFDRTIDLTDCALRRGSINMILEGELTPGEIKSFDVTTSSLTQSNNSVNIYIYDLILGQKISTSTVAYKAKAGASYAWLSVDGKEGWYSTYAMTPGKENIYQQFQTCEVGKHINVATGNCVKDPDPPAECAENQYRNPPTGRCKKLDSDKALAECADGQFRNPLTNRCKKIASDDELSPCAEGWERNPETNRCRKTPIGSEAAYAIDPVSNSSQDRAWLWIGGGGALVLGAMIAWQFHPEIARLFVKIASKVKR